MARNKRSLANRRPSTFTPQPVKQVCETWQLLERLALHQTTTHNWTFDEDVQAFSKLGVRAFGAWRFKVEDAGEHKALDLLKEHNLVASSLSWAGGFAYSDGESYDAAIADALDAVDMAQRIEAGTLVVLPGSRGSYTLNHGRRMVADALKRIGDAAGEAGVQIALQPVDPAFAGDGCFLENLDLLLNFLTDCGHPQIGLNLDVFHLRKVPRLVERLPELRDWIRLVQLSDCQQPVTDLDRCLLGEGALPLRDVIETLEAVGYRGFYEAQLMSTAAWNSSYSSVLNHTVRKFQDWCC